jgi:hypothetical protein
MRYKKIKLAVQLDASNFPSEVEEECVDYDISTHYQHSAFSLDWEDADEMPEMKFWLLATYGLEIRKHRSFLVWAT